MAEAVRLRNRPFSGKKKREVDKSVQRSSEKCLECEKEGDAVVMPCSPRCVYCPQCVVRYVVTQASRSCKNTVLCKQCRKEWLPCVVKNYGGASQDEIDEINTLLTRNLSLHDGMVTCPVCGTSYKLHRNVRMMRVRCEKCYRSGEKNCCFCWECKKSWTTGWSADHCGNAGCLGSSSAKKLVVLNEGISKGSYGAVYDALKGAVKVVAKVVHADLKDKEMENFKKEALLMQSLSHPNIVRCYGQEEFKGELYLVMEKMVGGTLYDVIEKRMKHKCFTSQQVGRQIASALEYLHGLEPLIIHRDLSSKNVLVSSSNVIKLADFGISRHMPSVLEYVRSCNPGTAQYMPPEVLGEDPKFTRTLDIFSLGVILLEVEIFEHPASNFHGIGTVPEVDRRKVPLDKVPPGNPIKEVIIKCLKDSYLARPSASNVRALLDRIK